MDKLSVVIITYNEERNIRPCLEAALKVADEVLVVDSFSTDCTLNICEELGVRFIQHEWKGYSEQKNFANAAASYDWILSVDADEVLDNTLQQAILEAKTKGFAGAYQVNRLTFYCGHPIRHCGWYPDIKLRLWNRTQGEWDGYIHEEVKLPAGTPIARLSGHLNHYSYHSISEHIRQADKFTDMTARAAFEGRMEIPAGLLLPARLSRWLLWHGGVPHLRFRHLPEIHETERTSPACKTSLRNV